VDKISEHTETIVHNVDSYLRASRQHPFSAFRTCALTTRHIYYAYGKQTSAFTSRVSRVQRDPYHPLYPS